VLDDACISTLFVYMNGNDLKRLCETPFTSDKPVQRSKMRIGPSESTCSFPLVTASNYVTNCFIVRGFSNFSGNSICDVM
jgi:hypothetical protein